MKMSAYRPVGGAWLPPFSLLLALAISLFALTRPALAACGTTTNVANQAQLNAAIADFNSQAGPCHYTIALANNILLGASTTAIDNPAANVELVIDGGGAYGVTGQLLDGVRPFTIAAATTVTLQDLLVVGGNVSLNGGGIHNLGVLTLSNSTVAYNSAGQEGGGIWNGLSGKLTLENGTTVQSNVAYIANAANDAQGGGGIFNNGGTVTLDHAMVSGNLVDGAAGVDDGGGGLFNDGRNAAGTITLDNATIADNRALTGWGNGGGLLNLGGAGSTPEVSISGGEITGNEAARAGGGLESNRGTISLDDVFISANSAGVNGGGLHTTGNDQVTIGGGTISNNSAGQEGGGVWNSATGTMTIQNGTIVEENTADIANATFDAQGGGGIFNNGGTLTVRAAIIRNNTVTGTAGADDGGGGLFNDGRNTAGVVTLTGTTIRGNTALTGQGNGGGILNIGNPGSTPELSITGGVISSNQALRAGGGIETNNGTVTLSGVSILDNTSAINGGGLHSTAADLVTIASSTISANSAGQEGGGVWNSAVGTMTIEEGTIVDGNTAHIANAVNDAQGGGGVFNNGGTLTISNATIANNVVGGTATVDDGGGGIFNDGRNTAGTLTIADTTIAGNTALTGQGNGGGILNIAADITVTRSSIVDNESANGGGGIFQDGFTSTLLLVNSTLSGNVVASLDGGGLDTEGGTATLTAVTVAGNTAAGDGGGINAAPGTNINLSATLVGDNTAGGSGPDLNGTFTSVENSLLENTAGVTIQSASGNILSLDAQLLPLAGYGGPTLVHALRNDSPALDAAGDTGLDSDQRGVPRPLGAADDIGAFERGSQTFLPIIVME